MRHLFVIGIVAAALALSACTTTGTVTADSVATWVKANCGIIVTVADIAAIISKNPDIASAATLGGQICDAFKAQSAGGGSAAPLGGVLTVDGMPVHYRR